MCHHKNLEIFDKIWNIWKLFYMALYLHRMDKFQIMSPHSLMMSLMELYKWVVVHFLSFYKKK